MKRIIRCADENSREDWINDKISDVKDDFDFVLSGTDKLIRSGNLDDAESIVDALSDDIQNILTILAGKIESDT